MADEKNPVAKNFRMARDRLSSDEDVEVSIRLISRRDTDGRTYNCPTASEVAALIEGDLGPNMDKRDIIVQKSCGRLQRGSVILVYLSLLRNPMLTEITRFVSKRCLNPEDRPDILCRVFKIKLDELMIDFNERHIFGRVRTDKFPEATDIDKIISAEKPESDARTRCRDPVGLYLSSCEATWRIFPFDIHHRTPAVERLQFHLLGKQSVFFNDKDPIDEVIGKSSMGVSKFLSWMKINNSDKEDLQGPKSYEDIRTVNDVPYPTYREACYAFGLIGDNREYIDAINQASEWGSGFYLRNLFATLLLSGMLAMPIRVWEQTWPLLSDDILRRQRSIFHNPGLKLTEEELKNYALIDIEESLQLNRSSLARFEGMPLPDTSITSHHQNTLVMDELSYDRESLQAEHASQLSSMTDEQRSVYNQIMEVVASNKEGMFFVYDYGETGKTFIWRTLCAALISRGEIVLPVAFSRIAAMLIPGGRIAHSRLGIPLNVTENSTCPRIKPGS
ncbi:uncharacterized protein LOC141641588 [Silene latifolia]|uniref:uncharacterized protein LOC141641588 n=1 Tax=Silene latifolia TaxID=37657 RepID=UPI003D78586A